MMPLKATNNALAHCDNAAHGYCFHLDEVEGVEALSLAERKEWTDLMQDGYDHFESIADVDEEIRDIQIDYDRAIEAADEAQEELSRLYDLKRLLEKMKSKPVPVPQRTDPPMIELGVLAEGAW